MTLKGFFSFKNNKFFWINIFAMIVVVILLIFGVFKWMDIYTRHGEAVVVPDAQGMSVREAEKLFTNHKLVSLVSDSVYVKGKPAGIVLDVSPAVGQKVKEGRTIYLTINTLDVPMHAVPDVADNSSLRQAQAKVLAAGFKLAAIQSVSGERDWVYGVKFEGRSLRGGDMAPLGAALTLMVGDGGGSSITDSINNVAPTETEDEPVSSESSSSSSAAQDDDSWF